MSPLQKLASHVASALLLIPAAHATVALNITANRLDTQFDAPVAAGTLIQIVNLGANGVFDLIDVNDASNSGINRWTSGDDTVLNIAFTTTVGGLDKPGDFASTAAFDLSYSTLTESPIGRFNRVFIFESGAAGLPVGTKLGIRWFPGLQAADYYAGTGINLGVNQPYGQFTRQGVLRNDNNALWIAPGDGANLTFDSLVTADSAATPPSNPDAADAGNAKFLTIPEPAAFGLSLLGTAGLTLLRRRRRR